MDVITYIIFFLMVLLLGYSSGRRYGYKQGYNDGKKYAPLDMKKDLLRTGRCPICYDGLDRRED